MDNEHQWTMTSEDHQVEESQKCHWFSLCFDGQRGVVVEILPTTQEVTGSIPAQCKHLCAWTCLFVLGLGVLYSIYAFTKKST
jgi:hypothetical protein